MKTHYSRLGLLLFFLYLLLYAGFMLLNTFWPETMEATPVAGVGVNVAILYGVGLIVAAFALALIYGVCAGSPEGKR